MFSVNSLFAEYNFVKAIIKVKKNLIVLQAWRTIASDVRSERRSQQESITSDTHENASTAHTFPFPTAPSHEARR